MKDYNIFDKSILKNIPTIEYDDVKLISYSQFSLYNKCPRSWYLKYVLKHKILDQSIHLIFGTAFHETFQKLLTLYFHSTVKEAEEFDIKSYLKNLMFDLYDKDYQKSNIHYSSPKELSEFYNDGVLILEYFKKKRNLYFSKKTDELVGWEIPLFIPVQKTENSKVCFLGYIDLILKDKKSGKYTLYDIKTSTRGWNDYKKKDHLTISQLILYKKYFSIQYNIPLEDIDVQYFIVKRKINTESEFPQKRIQEFKPAVGVVNMNKTDKLMSEFINTSFINSEYNTDENSYKPLAGSNYNNCKFCIFSDNELLCPKNNRYCN